MASSSTTSTTSGGNEEMVKLNVGGKLFTTYKSTLMAYPDTMLARMFSTSAEIAKKGPDGEYFLDRNPDLFNIILEFYRNKALIVPKTTPLEALYNELQYFGIDYEEDDIQIAGEPKHAPIDCFLSLVDAYKSLPSKGHLLGNVIVGLPLSDYEADEYADEANGGPLVSEQKEAKTRKLYEDIGKSHKRQLFGNLPREHDSESESDLSDLSDLSISSEEDEEDSEGDGPKKKKTKKDTDQIAIDKKDKQPENGPYQTGTLTVLEKIKDSLSEISYDSFFCCGGIDKTTAATLKILPDPNNDNSNKNNNNNIISNNNNNDNKPVCQYGASCYRKNPQHIKDFFHPPAPPKFMTNKMVLSDPWIDCGNVANLNIDLIKNLCSPAPFGDLKTMQTKLDPNVRLALECNSNRFTLPLNLKSAPQYIMTKLNNDHELQLVPYKLNIYEPGGFFKEHVDTPIQPDKMLGSLVVCLPSLHEGGELKVTHNGLSHTFDFAPKSGNTSIFQWAAFYSDCVHEVKPVTKGTRITVTYLINDKNGDKNYFGSFFSKKKSGKAFCGPADPTKSITKIDKLVDILQELPPSLVKVGWFLNHKYTTTAIDKETLKGSDKLMIEQLGNKWDYHLTSVIYNEYMKEYVGEYDSREFNEKSGSVYAFSMEDLKYLNGKGPKPTHKYSHVPFVVSSQKGKLLYHNDDPGAEHTGNESRPAESDSVYFHAAVILTRK